jgi:hypothetical protein
MEIGTLRRWVLRLPYFQNHPAGPLSEPPSPVTIVAKTKAESIGADMEYLRFPAWQTMCVNALRETNPKNLRNRLKEVEKAILLRAQRIQNSTIDNDEKLAINEAPKSLRHLKGISEWI